MINVESHVHQLIFTLFSAVGMAERLSSSPRHDHFAYVTADNVITVGTAAMQRQHTVRVAQKGPLLPANPNPKPPPKLRRKRRSAGLKAPPTASKRPRSVPSWPSYVVRFTGPPVPLEGDALIADLYGHIALLDKELDSYL